MTGGLSWGQGGLQAHNGGMENQPEIDGLPEPLQFQLNDGLRFMLIPAEGFEWVVGNREVAQSGHSECVISITAGSESGVDELVKQALQAGGEIVTGPGQKPWG